MNFFKLPIPIRILVLVACLPAKINSQGLVLSVADSLYATGNYTKAINYYAKASTEKSGLQIARAYNAIGNYDKAVAQYQSVANEHADWQIAGFELGKLLLKTKRYDEARKLLSDLTKKNNYNPEYHYYLGEVYRELDQPASSLISYKKAVEIDSTHLRSLFQLGKYFTVQQETNQALGYIETGLRFYGNDVSFINLKALNLFNDGQYKMAIIWFERLLEMGETQTYIYQKLAYSYYKNWDFEKAKKIYRKWIDIDDTNSEAYFGMSTALQKNQQLDSAEIYTNKAMDVQRPILADGYSRLAVIARERNDLKSALEYYRRAHEEDPKDDFIYFNICTTADQYFEDPKVKLTYYENFIGKFGKDSSYTSEIALKRIKELKEEIHYRAE